jgi:hypothetical protein
MIYITGPEPTTTEFTAIYYGPKYRSVKGNVLIADTGSQFAGLETFGQVICMW